MPPSQTTPQNRLDPAALMKIKDLALRARTVVEGMARGLHRSPLHGFSVEFTEYRPYAIGDDPKFIDWKLFGRTDRYYIKRFEDETNLRCWFVLDRSKSMEFGSIDYTKLDYAKTLVATLSYFLLHQQDAVGLATFDTELRHFLPARFRSGQWHHVLVGLESPAPGVSTEFQTALEDVAQLLRRRGLVVILSDMLTDLDAAERGLRLLKASGHDLVMLRLLDPMELNFQLQVPTWVKDLESGKRLHIDENQSEDYSQRFQAHQEQLESLCNRYEIDFFSLSTAEPLDQALFGVLHSRMQQQSRQVRRQNAGGR